MTTNMGYARGYIDLDTSGLTRNLDQAQRRFDNFIGSTGKRMQSWGDNIANVGSQWTMFSAPLAAVGAYGLNAASQFEDSMAMIQARTGITGEALDRVREKALQLGRDTKYSATESSDAILQLTTAGLSLEQALIAVDGVMLGAAASNMEIAKTADIATNVMSAFNLQAEDTHRIMDTMFKGSAASPATMEEMGEALARAGGFAQNYGLSLEDTGAIMAIFAQRNIRGSEAATQLRSVLRTMGSDTADVTGIWTELGLSMFDAEGNMRDMNDIMNDLHKALDGVSDEERIRIINTLAGAYGQVGFNALLGMDSIEDMSEKMGEQADFMKVAQNMMATFSGKVTSLKGSFEGLMISALSPFMQDFLTPMIDKGIVFVNGISDWIEKNQELSGKIVKFLAIAIAIGPMLFGVGKAISFVGFMLTMLASPMVWLIALGGLLAKAYMDNFMGMQEKLAPMITFFQNLFASMSGGAVSSSPIITFFQQLATQAQAVFGRILTFIHSFFDTLNQGGTVLDGFRMAITNALFATGLSGMVLRFFNNFVIGIQSIAMWLTAVAIPALISFAGYLMGIWTNVQPYLFALWNWFTTVGLPMAMNFITGTAIPIIGSVISWLMRLWTDVQPFLFFLYNWFMTTALPMLIGFLTETVMPTVSNFIGLLKDIWILVQPYLQQLYDWFMTTGLPLIETYITGPFTTAFQGILNLLAGAWSFVSEGITALRDNLSEIFAWIKDHVIQPVIDIVNDLFGLFADVITKAQEVGSAVANAIPGAEGFGLAGDTMGQVFSGEISGGDFGKALWHSLTSMDRGGAGRAGQAYMIGTGAQPEMYIPNSDGTFIPNADRNMGGITLNGVTIVANDPEDFVGQLSLLEQAGG